MIDSRCGWSVGFRVAPRDAVDTPSTVALAGAPPVTRNEVTLYALGDLDAEGVGRHVKRFGYGRPRLIQHLPTPRRRHR
jgi:hypothetical protein